MGSRIPKFKEPLFDEMDITLASVVTNVKIATCLHPENRGVGDRCDCMWDAMRKSMFYTRVDGDRFATPSAWKAYQVHHENLNARLKSMCRLDFGN